MVASGWGNDQISQWMQSHPEEFQGYSITGKDTITDAQGNVFDFRNGMGADPNGQGTAQWTQVGGPGGTQGLSYNGSIPTGGISGYGGPGGIIGSILGTGAGGYGGSSSSFSGYNLPGMGGLPTGAAGDLYSTLQGRASQNIIPSASDPIIAAQVNAYRAEQERGTRNYLEQQAEAQGPYANLGSERRLADEQAAQATGTMQSQLMQNELNARRQEVQQALSGQLGLLSDQQKIALQQQLGYIDAALRQQSITNQNNQFVDQLGLSATQQANYWDALRSGLLG
jgi:hypothetical protein